MEPEPREPSINETFAILLARDFRPEDMTFSIGANMPMARSAVLLANLTTHPHARVHIGLGHHNLSDGRSVPPIRPFVMDPRTLDAESWMWQSRIFDNMHEPDIFFVGGIQLDRRGNLNLFGLPNPEGGWAMRGPGGIALSTMSSHARGYYIVMPRHDRRTFVDEVALVSALGDRRERDRFGLPGGGIRLVLSPLGVFDFDDEGDMRVRSIHSGVSPDQLREATGFPIEVSDETPRTPSPTVQELELLRGSVDVDGVLV